LTRHNSAFLEPPAASCSQELSFYQCFESGRDCGAKTSALISFLEAGPRPRARKNSAFINVLEAARYRAAESSALISLCRAPEQLSFLEPSASSSQSLNFYQCFASE
jgi:hypothetical protein